MHLSFVFVITVIFLAVRDFSRAEFVVARNKPPTHLCTANTVALTGGTMKTQIDIVLLS